MTLPYQHVFDEYPVFSLRSYFFVDTKMQWLYISLDRSGNTH
jgi:hypothetical protein